MLGDAFSANRVEGALMRDWGPWRGEDGWWWSWDGG